MATFFRISIAMLLVILSSVFAIGQGSRSSSTVRDTYLISAKAGGVNYVEGDVWVRKADGRESRLVHRDQIVIGERVRTGNTGRAEVLLNPGSYVRLGASTAMEFISTSLDDLQLRLDKGSAVFEVIADDDFRVSVKTPDTQIAITRSGVYRVDVPGDGTAAAAVLKGKLFVGETKVKAGRSIEISPDGTTVAKFDRDNDDPLEVWSKSRAKTLAQANSKLERDALRNSLMNSFMSRGWNMYNSFGLWIFDPFRRMFCFLPFGSGWGSPYGYYYGLDTWNAGLPRWIYYQGPMAPFPPPASSPAPPKGRPIDNGDTHGRIEPPFRKIEQNQKGAGDGVVNRRIGLPRDDAGWSPQFPTSSPARSVPSAPPASAAPPPTIALPRKEKP